MAQHTPQVSTEPSHPSEAAPYKHPKLSAAAIARFDGQTFAEALERCLERSKGTPMLNPPTVEHEELVPASEMKKPFQTYRRA